MASATARANRRREITARHGRWRNGTAFVPGSPRPSLLSRLLLEPSGHPTHHLFMCQSPTLFRGLQALLNLLPHIQVILDILEGRAQSAMDAGCLYDEPAKLFEQRISLVDGEEFEITLPR